MMEKVSRISTIRPAQPDDLFLTCASFEEERCIASLQRLSAYRTRCAIVINFLSRTNPYGEKVKRRTASYLATSLKDLDELGIPRLLSVGPYNFPLLLHHILDELTRRRIGTVDLHVTIDISCLTKVQLIFLLKTLIEEKIVAALRLFYATPIAYNTEGDKFTRLSIGYYDPISLPLRKLGSSSVLKSHRLALVLLGHEGQRTLCAWRRIEPDETLLVCAASDDASLIEVSNRENKFLLDQVEHKRPGFSRVDCDHLHVQEIRSQLISFLTKLRVSGETRVSIVPFGPKPVVVGVLLSTLSMCEVDFDLMYPIPTSYNSRYSEGVKEVYTIRLL